MSKTRLTGKATLTERGTLRKFDIIVGNPPWSYRGQETTAARRYSKMIKEVHVHLAVKV